MFALIRKTAVVAIVFFSIGGVIAVGGLWFVTMAVGKSPRWLLSQVTDYGAVSEQVIINNERLAAIEARILNDNFTQFKSQAAQPPENAPPRGQGGSAAGRLGSSPIAPPSQLSPVPKFQGDVPLEQIVMAPQAQPPVFERLDRTQPDVCPDGSCRYLSVSEAFKAMGDGAVIIVAPGLYFDCLDSKDKSFAIVGLTGDNGERPTFTEACSGKGTFVSSGPRVLLKGLRIDGVEVPDRNGACLRLYAPPGRAMRAMVSDVICSNSQNGLLANVGDGTLIVESSLFVANGFNNGRSHGIYVDAGEELVVRNTIVHSTKGKGHTLKAGTKRLFVESSILAGLEGENSRTIDYFSGGLLHISDSVLQQGKNADNHDMIGLALERQRMNLGSVHAAVVEDSWLIFDDPGRCCRWMVRGRKLGEFVMKNTTMVAVEDYEVKPDRAIGVKRHGSRRRAGLPAYDGSLQSLPTPKAWGG